MRRTAPHRPSYLPLVFAVSVSVLSTLLRAQGIPQPGPPPEPSGGAVAPRPPASTMPEAARGARMVVPPTTSYAPPTDEPAVALTFDSTNFDDNSTLVGGRFIPPDPHGAAGPNHVVSVVNCAIRIHTKTGTETYSRGLGESTSGGPFFAPLSPVNAMFDPKVIYDNISGRFVVVALERTDTANGAAANTSRILVAASQTNDPNGAWRYLEINSKLTIGGVDNWADYPGFAADEEAIYITNNMFGFGASGTYGGSRLWIINKSQFYSGATPTVTVHDPFGATGIASNGTLQPTHISGTAGIGGATGVYFLNSGWFSGADDFLSVIRVANPLTAPSFTNQFLALGDIRNETTPHPNAPQSGSSTLINTNELRVQNAVWRANRIYACNTINPSTGPDAGQATAHWYVINATNPAAVTLEQQGNIGGEEIAAGTCTFFPSIAVNGAGDFIVGFAASAPTIFPGAYCAVHLATDASNTMRPALTVAAGLDFYVRTFSGTRNRWGDYSGTVVDPVDDSTFWIFNEYASTRGSPSNTPPQDGRWATRWARILPVPPVNTPPVVALPGPPPTFTEDGAPVVIDGIATVIDADSVDFNTGTLTTDFTANGTATDRLAIRHQGNLAGQIGVSGAAVSFGGTGIGTFTGGTNSALVVTFNSAAATPAAAQALLRNITFENTSQDPSTAARTVRVVITDGDGGTSIAATKNVSVVAVNDPPTLAAVGNPPAINEDAGTQTVNLNGISAGTGETQPLAVTATSDNTALIPNPSVTYTSPNATGSLSYTPTANSSGSATITVTVNDGQSQNNTVSRTFTAVVNAVNDPPIANPQSVTTPQNTAKAITLTGSDIENSALSFSIVDPPGHGALSGSGANLTYTPDNNYNGPDSFTFRVNDGQANSAPATVSIVVGGGPNQPPVANPQSVGTSEDIAVPITLTGTDPEGATLTFIIVTQPANGALTGNGANRTYTPAADFNGSDSFTFKVSDGGADSNTATVGITIAAVNDPPSFEKGPDQSPLPNAGLQTVPGWASNISAGPADEGGQTLTFAAPTNNDAIFATLPAISDDGTLTYELIANATGSATVTVTLSDSGGTANGGDDTSDSQTLIITASPTNDPPSFDLKAGDSSSPRGGKQTVKKFATKISPGPADESVQKVKFILDVPAADQLLFKTQPAISASGTLTYTPKPGTSGTATVTVRLQDDGGTAGGGVDTSAPQTCTISILAFADEAGTYNGLARSASGTPRAEETGLIRLEVSRTGKWTAKLKLAGRGTFRLRGKFDESGVAHFGRNGSATATLKRKNRPDVILTLELEVNASTDKLKGTLSENNNPFATIDADRALYTSKKNPTPPRQNVPPALRGRYTVLLAAKTPAQQGLAADQFPQGDGYGALKVSKSGTARIAGALADGTKISYGNKLSKINEWPFWVSLFRGKGAIAGPVTFRETVGTSDLDGLDLMWFRPAKNDAKRYPAGWPQGIKVDLLGSVYDLPPKNPPASVLPGLGPVDADGNAEFGLSDGNLSPSPFVKALNIKPNNEIKVVDRAADKLDAEIKAKNGTFRGTLIHPASSKESRLRGVIFQKQQLGSGFFLGPTESGAVTIKPDDSPGGP